MQPFRTAFLPRKAASKQARGVDVTFQIGETVVAGRIIEVFFAGFAGRADGDHPGFHRFTARDAIVAGHLEQAHVTLAVVEVPFERRGHGDDTGRTQDAGFFRQRIRQPRGSRLGRAEQRVAFLGHVGNGENFSVTEADQTLAQARFGFVVGQAGGALACRGQARRKFVQAVDARDLFDQIDFALDLPAPGGLRAFPGCQQRFRRAAVLVHAYRSKPEGAEGRLDLPIGDVRAHDAENFRAGQADFLRRALARVDVHHAREQFADGILEDQLGAAARGQLGHFRIGAAAKARGSFGVQFQNAGGAAGGDGVEPGALDQHVFRGKRNFGFRSAHDAADAYRAGTVAVRDPADAGIECAQDAVERSQFLFGLGFAYDEAMVAHGVVIKRMEGVPELEHDIVGHVDDVVDAGDDGGLTTLAQPSGPRLYHHAATDPRCETSANFRHLNLHAHGIGGLRQAFLRLRRNQLERQLIYGADLARHAVVPEAIRPVRRDLGVEHRAVPACFNAAYVGSRQSQARGQFLRRCGDVDKILQPVVNDLHALFLS